MAPAGVPKDIIAKLSAECTRILKLAEIKERFAGLGAEAVGGSPEELAATIQSESARWGDVVRKQHITVE
jgi:tripartite-type tricarboxylate transporter receptor subunit TctC